jgi:hypothetical protein
MGLEQRIARLEGAYASLGAPPGRWVLITIYGTPAPPARVLPDVPPGEVRYLMQDPDADLPAWDWAALERHAPHGDVSMLIGRG